MGRRNLPPDIVGIVAPLVALLFLFIFAATGYNWGRASQIMQGLMFLLFIGVIVVVVGVILFFVIRAVIRAKPRHVSYNFSPTSSPPPFRRPPIRVAPEPGSPVEYAPPPKPDVISQLRDTDWYQFEKVVGLVYQSQGYRLTRRGGQNPDGGIDLIVEKDGERAAVQCKRWKKWKLDVPKVRELIGAMTHEGLSRGVMVALNGFTLEAKQLAVAHNIDIVHDKNLATMIDSLAAKDQLKVQVMLEDKTKHCPKCESIMIWRTPKPGKKQFTPFWGCSRYPLCHGRLQED